RMAGELTGADRELFERSLRHATATQTGAALDDALTALGWHDALEVDPQTTISLLFELQGATNVTSSALDPVLASALGLADGTSSVVLPALGRGDAPGRLDPDQRLQ